MNGGESQSRITMELTPTVHHVWFRLPDFPLTLWRSIHMLVQMFPQVTFYKVSYILV